MKGDTMANADEAETPTHRWRVTCNAEGGIEVNLGPKLSELAASDTAKMHAVAKSLIRVGTQLLESSVSEDDDNWDGDDDWDDEVEG